MPGHGLQAFAAAFEDLSRDVCAFFAVGDLYEIGGIEGFVAVWANAFSIRCLSVSGGVSGSESMAKPLSFTVALRMSSKVPSATRSIASVASIASSTVWGVCE